MTSPSDTAAMLSSMAHRLYAGGDISDEERAGCADAVRVLSFVGRHQEGLRLLCERLSPRGERRAAADPGHDAALASHPAVAAALEAFPGSAIDTVRAIDIPTEDPTEHASD